MIRLNPMRRLPFRAGSVLASGLLLGLLASIAGGAATRGFAAPVPLATETGIPASIPSMDALPQGDAPAFAGRVDPETYRVGPGDEFAFRSSDLNDPKIVRVGPAGELLLPDVGPIPVAGLTLREVEARAREALRPYVRGKGFVLTLHRPRRFLAVVTGAVLRPGTVLVQAPVRASDAIEAAGGVVWPGARRGIAVRRGADTLWVDLDRFQQSGDLDANPLVFETDVIVVPAGSRKIEVRGAVGRPGEYDLAPGDRVESALAAAGGLLARAAADRITLSREPAPGRREEITVRLEADGAALPLQPGDRLFVPELGRYGAGASVVVEGEVAFPGPYSIVDGEDRLGDLLRRAGGLAEWADSAALRVERESNAAVRDSAFVRLAREQSGLVNENERDYLVTLTRENRAVSLSAEAWEESGRSIGDLTLRNGDRIVAPRRSRTVLVQGEVKAPGHVAYVPGRGVADYIADAGGYTGRASKGGVRITLAATGRQVEKGDVEALHEGDVVWVPARQRRSFWSSARDVLTTVAQVVTIYLVVREANR
ncbi:MAG TPA: SLBB domain-containing protein [Acidobacteriota bacterium]|nr:SLBB domain-containing protein [Acidobacteriota bacterium]